jgi:hypothetical protein
MAPAERTAAVGVSVARALRAGVAGTAAMTLSTAIEMRVRGRGPSDAPAAALERLPGVRLRGERARAAVSWGAHAPFGVALGAAREVLGRTGLREPGATLAFFGVAWLPDLAIVPALGAADPPWRWPAVEWALSALHHAVYAVAGSAAWGR